jgi:adenylate kinase family enzyme
VATLRWQDDAMRAYLITGNPGSGKSTLAAELSRRGLAAVDADELAYWEDISGKLAAPRAGSGDDWLLAHRWIWSRSRIRQAIADAGCGTTAVFVCGIARNQAEMMDMFHKVFLLVIDEQTQDARLAGESPARPAAVRQQIRDGRPVFQAQMLSQGAIVLDGTALPADIADRLLAQLDLAAWP